MRIHPILDYLNNFLLGPGRNMCMKKDCGAGRDLLSIASDGSIEACGCIDTKGPYANLGLVQIGKPNSLQEARESEPAKLIRSRDITLGQCRDCSWLAVCGGTCMAHAHGLHEVWKEQCKLSMLAFGRISRALADDRGRLKRYWASVTPENEASRNGTGRPVDQQQDQKEWSS